MAEIQTYPDGTPVLTDKVPYVADPGGLPQLKLAPVSAIGGGAGVAVFGDGSDGDVIVNAPVNLARDMYYDNLTVTETGVVRATGCRIFVKGTLTNAGSIHADGATATGTPGAAATPGIYLPGTAAGGDGGTSGEDPPNPGTAIAQLGCGGNGGNGGDLPPEFPLAGMPGAAGGTVTAPTAAYGWPRAIPASLTNLAFAIGQAVDGWRGGGGGGGGGTQAEDAGGGGAGGGVVLIAARTIDNGSGSISADGGNGFSPAAGNAGGGGGGGGGLVLITCQTLAAAGTITVAGGTGGTGSGTAGAGVNGSSGTIITITS